MREPINGGGGERKEAGDTGILYFRQIIQVSLAAQMKERSVSGFF